MRIATLIVGLLGALFWALPTAALAWLLIDELSKGFDVLRHAPGFMILPILAFLTFATPTVPWWLRSKGRPQLALGITLASTVLAIGLIFTFLIFGARSF